MIFNRVSTQSFQGPGLTRTARVARGAPIHRFGNPRTHGVTMRQMQHRLAPVQIHPSSVQKTFGSADLRLALALARTGHLTAAQEHKAAANLTKRGLVF